MRKDRRADAGDDPEAGGSTRSFWSKSPDVLLAELGSSQRGLSEAEAEARLRAYGRNETRRVVRHRTARLLFRQFRSPISLLLLITAVLSGFVGERADAAIILVILFSSAALGFWQESRAEGVVEQLLAMIRTTARVRRDGEEREIPADEVVPGDLVVMRAGDLVPADGRLLDARDLDVDESALTGESFPVSKNIEPAAPDAALAERNCALFQGTNVVSGTAVVLVVATGRNTLYGSLADAVERRRSESDFEHGVRHFGYLLLQITGALVLVVFAVNMALQRPVLEVFLFSLALAVGLTPQLLPAIVSVTLAHGARNMAKREVVVRRLVAIEEFGGLQILCTDKTGTLTAGRVQLHRAVDARGQPSERALRLVTLNAYFQSGFDNPVDNAIRAERPFDTSEFRKLDEVPYDFVRRRLSVLLQQPDGRRILITKGAVTEMLSICNSADFVNEINASVWRPQVEDLVEHFGAQGFRCLAVAYKWMDADHAGHRDEQQMILAGIIALADPPKDDASAALARLATLGVRVKMITGDNQRVAATVAREVGLDTQTIVTGPQVDRLTDHALQRRAVHAAVFAEVDPNQKERVILALRHAGYAVGYLGDGVNDAAALHAANVGISVDSAVDVTRRAADIVLLRKDLNVLAEGIEEGRRAFANTLKYVFVATSARFGNMFSMAGASLLAAWLPMLPKQILLLNLLSDLPAMTIATDRLDPELVARPRGWDVRFIRDFMIIFGLISSAFDYMTFGLLLLIAVPVGMFRTAWFVESVLTEIFVLLVIRSARPFYRSTPSKPLLLTSVGVALFALWLPFSPLAPVLGLVPLPLNLLAALFAISGLLLISSELGKRYFFAHHPLGRERRGGGNR